MSRCRFAPGTIPRCSIRSQYSRAQKTVEKTVKQLETGGKFQTSVKDNENGVTATAASQGHRANAGGRMGMPQKRKGRRSVACAPHTSLELLHFCFSEHCLCACRGQRHLIGYHNKHPIGANKHGHRHYRCGDYELMFHLLELSSSFRALSRYTLWNSANIISKPTITGSIAICQADDSIQRGREEFGGRKRWNQPFE
jgi:hypothetical protein